PDEVIAGDNQAILAYLRNQAQWHAQRLMIGIGAGVSVLMLSVWGLVWYRRRGLRKEKPKRSA
ncbi:MAG: hypothetical protein AAFQ07_11155, partial [Chloroflexota bacterium]